MNNNFVVTIPRDLNQIKSKLFFGLTKRQIIGLSLAIALGLPVFYFLWKLISVDVGLYGLFIVASPILFMAIYQKNGIPAEICLKIYLESKFIYSSKKKYAVNKKNIEIAKKRGMVRDQKKKLVPSPVDNR